MQIDTLEQMLQQGQDGAMLRYGLASAYWQQGDVDKALTHAGEAINFQPAYSAAWQLYAKALEASGYYQDALRAYHEGHQVAEEQGDKQVANVLSVLYKKLKKKIDKQ